MQRCLIAQSLNPWIHISFRIMLPPLYCWSYPAILSFQRDWLTGIPRAILACPFLLFFFGLQSKGRHHAEAPWNGPRKQKDQKSGLSGLKGKLSGRKDGSKKFLPKKSLRLWFGLWNLRDGQFLRIHLQMLTEPQRQQLRRFFRCLEKKVCKYGKNRSVMARFIGPPGVEEKSQISF